MVMLPLFWLGVRTLGLRRMQAVMSRSRQPFAKTNGEEIRALSELVNRAAHHHPLPASCLTRSLLLAWLLRRRGWGSELRIGVRLNDGSLDAHAWLECDGIPVNDRADIAGDFRPFEESFAACARKR
jgi:hypothetical protein